MPGKIYFSLTPRLRWAELPYSIVAVHLECNSMAVLGHTDGLGKLRRTV